MTSDRRLLTCPACGRDHTAPAGATDPHYCSIACYRSGHGLDDPATGDGRRWCAGCKRYFDTHDDRRWCSDACRVADWRRRQPPRPPSPPAGRRAANMRTMSLAEVTTEHAPAPYIGDDSATVLNEAIVSLGKLRGLQFVGDAGAVLHLLASLTAQIDTLLPAAVVDARDQDYTWSEIAALAALSRDRVQRLAAHQPQRRAPPAD
ncbi:MAG: hypothetical protein ACRDZ0_00710 [Acidimicrobiales bacterium]